ncbi:leucine-rich repeat transmembrane neuronal protein 4-like [Anopheles maculipalpis]|uniref:leucine-rich repeat transmembrane neuronal protein 4-like n=1 Tax=Anopheles maculipalpis TaxID=1496333 RepID=UPI002159B1B9|nr:leucine-rich repeat transmembrane neuronal protein 4-like [Anopheles maculipalpis]
MNYNFVAILLFVLPTAQYEFVCVYDMCTISNINIPFDGLYAFSFITNHTDALILKSATGKRMDFTFLQNIPTLREIVLEDCKFEEIVIHQLKPPASLMLRHVSLKQILFHPSVNALTHVKLCGVPFTVIPQSVLQLQQLVDLEQSRSPMRQLHLTALRKLPNLVNLNLSYNKIQTVVIDTSGDCCGQLQSLNLVGNVLVHFNFGMLFHLQQLERVFLGHNRIATLSTAVSHNYSPKRQFCSWRNYYQVKIEDNITIPEPPCNDYFAKLNTITLNHNKLAKIDLSTFERMNVLEDLDLAFNDLKVITLAKGKVPISLNISMLKGNRGYLHDLPPDVFSGMT